MKAHTKILILFCLLLALALTATAQTEMQGTAIDNVNVRTGPDTTYTQIGKVLAGNTIFIEGRNQRGDWLLVHTPDSSLRGWVASRYINWQDGLTLVDMPVSDEILNAPAVNPPPSTEDTGNPETPLDDTANINAVPDGIPVPPPPPQKTLHLLTPEREREMIAMLSAMPVIPSISNTAVEIYRLGQANGRTASAVTKVGDCNAGDPRFLDSFAHGDYTLGEYGYLLPAIQYYAWSLAESSPAARLGNTSNSVTDPIFADPALCNTGETTIQCAYRRSNAAIAVITFGMFESFYVGDLDVFRQGMDTIISEAVNRGIIPVMIIPSTVPGPHQGIGLEYNRVMVELGRQYGIPVINYWRAARTLPGYGLSDDQFHFSDRNYHYTHLDFIGEQHTLGYTLLNLVIMQTLHEIYHAVN